MGRSLTMTHKPPGTAKGVQCRVKWERKKEGKERKKSTVYFHQFYPITIQSSLSVNIWPYNKAHFPQSRTTKDWQAASVRALPVSCVYVWQQASDANLNSVIMRTCSN